MMLNRIIAVVLIAFLPCAVMAEEAIDYQKKQAVVVAKKSTIFRGDQYEADIIMSNPTPKCTYRVFLDEKEMEGAHYSKKGSDVGNIECRGYILETNKKGISRKYPFAFNYQVIEPWVDMSVVGGNVLYAGYSSKIEVSVPGVPQSELRIGAVNASVQRTENGFTVKPIKIGANCALDVSAYIDGKSCFIGRREFRVAPLPTPTINIKRGERLYNNGISKKVFCDTDSVVVAALIPDYDFSAARFVISEFYVKCVVDGKWVVYHSNSSVVTEEMKNAISKLREGDSFFLSDVKMKGDDRIPRIMSAEFKIKASR